MQARSELETAIMRRREWRVGYPSQAEKDQKDRYRELWIYQSGSEVPVNLKLYATGNRLLLRSRNRIPPRGQERHSSIMQVRCINRKIARYGALAQQVTQFLAY